MPRSAVMGFDLNQVLMAPEKYNVFNQLTRSAGTSH